MNEEHHKLSVPKRSNASFQEFSKTRVHNISVGSRRRRISWVSILPPAITIVGLMFLVIINYRWSLKNGHNHSKSFFGNRKSKFGKQDIVIDEFKEMLEEILGMNEKLDWSDNNDSTRYSYSIEPWKDPKLFDVNFAWLKNNEDICIKGSQERIKLLPVLVHTARSHFKERNVLRESWGTMPIYKGWDIRFVFLMGMANTSAMSADKLKKEEHQLLKEHEDFGDIAIGNFIDSYHNLTYKHLMGYKWVLNFCREATYVLKIDDDVFIDIMTWVDWLEADLGKLEKNGAEVVPDIYCKMWKNAKPYRTKNRKWFTTYEDWPDEYFPDYCNGWAYTVTVDLMEKIYLSSLNVKFNWVDDLYVTGQLIDAVREDLDYVAEIKDISSQTNMYTKEYRSQCDKGDLKEKRKFKVMAKVERDKNFRRDMLFMWNKVLYDRKLLDQ